jgi:hypothetical protein
MAQKKIEVVIDGKEFVSEAAGKAEKSVESFSSKVKNFLAPLAALGIGAALGGFFRKAIEESLEGEQSMQRMQTAVSNAGQSFEQMRPKIDRTIGDLTRLTIYTDDQLMAAFSDMTVQTGNANGALGNLGLAADLAALKSIPLETASSAIGKAMAGNTTALTKLIPQLKGSSDIMGDLRIKVEGTAEKMGGTFAGSIERAKNQFAEFAQAVGDAIIGADSMQGSGNRLVDLLVQMTQWVEANRTEIGTLASGLLDLGEFLVNVSVILVETFGAGLSIIKRAIWGLAGATAITVGEMLKSFGILIEKGGKFLKIFGVDVVEATGKKLKDAGQDMVDVNKNKLLNVEADWYQAQVKIQAIADRWSGNTVASVTKVGASLDGHGATLKKSTAVTEEEIKKQDAAWKQYLKDYEAGIKRLNDAYDAYLKLLPKLQPALQEAMQTQHIAGQNRALEASKVAADAAFKAIKDGATPLPALIKKSEDAVGDMGGKLSDAAGYVLDVADEFGALDEEAKTVLTSVQTIGASVQDMMKGGLTFAGVAGILGAVGAIVNALTAGSRERKILELESQARLRDNTTQMTALTRQMGQLNLDVSGATVSGVENVIADIMSYPGLAESKDPFAREQIFFNLLNNKGISKADFFDLMKKFGLDVLDKNGNIDFKQLPLILATLQGTNTAAPGNDFASRLDILKSGFAVNNTSEIGQIGQLIGLGGSFSDTLKGVFDPTDLAGSRERLKGLFNDVAAGKLTEAQLGGLTGNQFLSLITDIIGRIDNLSPSTGSGSTGTGAVGGGAAGGGSAGGGTVTSGGTVVPTKTLADVLDGVTAQTTALGAYHVQHLNIATAHLNEARTQTTILMDIADNTRGFKSGSVVDLLDTGLEAQRSMEAAERGLGASY